MEARELVKMEYGNSKNPFSSHILSYGWILKDRMAYELSYGRWDRDEIYGVSIVEYDENSETKTKRRSDLAEAFNSKQEAKEYIKQLRNNTKGK